MNNNQKQITTIILAGGNSTRMGRDKALIEINNIPLLRYVYQIATECSDQVWIITPFIDKYQTILPDNCHFLPEKSENPLKARGPLIAFAQALTQLAHPSDWILLLACDLPKLRADILQQWQQQLLTIPDEYIAFLAKNEKGWQCLCGFYRYSCLNSLQQFIGQGGTSFQRWLESCPVYELSVSNPEIFFNCNTPDDLSRAF